MKLELAIKNIVLVGTIDIQSFDKYFFIKNEIVTEEGILSGSIFNGLNGVNLVTSQFHIIVQPNQIILSDLNQEVNDNVAMIAKKLLAAKNAIFTGAGINFQYFLSDDQSKIEQLSKRLFFTDIEISNRYFNTDDAQYGLYLSKDVDNARLKLDIKPAVVQHNITLESTPIILFQFNFHKDIIDQLNWTDFIQHFDSYYTFYQESKNIMSLY